MYIVAALYKFTSLSDLMLERLCAHLKNLVSVHKISGTLILAHEGINGTVAGSREAIDALKDFLKQEALFENMEYKESQSPRDPFYRMKVKIKKEIVTLNESQAKPSEISGTYVSPQEWNELLKDPDIIVIDTRNDYEVKLGTFKGSVNPKTTNFTEFPEFVRQNLDPAKHKKVAMSCTGGIRCEKASSYMKSLGFSEVFHLKGGILKYLEEIKESESLWQGECFVFDHRVSVDHALKPGCFELCHGCGLPMSDEEKNSPHFQQGVCCGGCYDKRSDKQKAAALSRQQQMDLAKAQGLKHLGR